MHSRLSSVTVQMLLYPYVNLRLMNKLTNEMGNFFTDTMRDSNSHEFEEMVDPITYTPNEEPEENIVEIDETFSEKESSVTTVFSWSNFSVQNRGSAAMKMYILTCNIQMKKTPSPPLPRGGKKIPLLLIHSTHVNDESFYNFPFCLF